MRERDYYNRYRESSPYGDERIKRFREHRQRNRMFFGIAMVVVGICLFLHTMGLLPYFSARYSWPYILILIGIFSGLKHKFRNNAWWILILIGIINLTPQFVLFGHPSSHFVWPFMIILGGLAIAFRPRKDRCYPGHKIDSNINNASTLNIDATFGGRKEVVTSKDFRGGLVSLTFAGCELNLAQADFAEGPAVLDCRVSFGGLEIVVPSHWEIQNEINPSFGSVEDDRVIQTNVNPDNKKVLILRGSCSFGSIEIKSY